LYASEDFPLQHGNEREESEKYTEQCKNVDESRCYLHYPIRSAGQWYEQQLFYANENLIKRRTHPP
jgi:hypothetical protein